METQKSTKNISNFGNPIRWHNIYISRAFSLIEKIIYKYWRGSQVHNLWRINYLESYDFFKINV